ncbi:MAG TPA: oligoendopeptidase F, partial [Rhizobium sp.]|nr:oligoendopeptidase F [Rhizobium sp.]
QEKPHQLDDKLEQLFLEKSQTGAAAFNRLFDETLASLKFEVDGKSQTLEPTLNMLQDSNPATRQKAAEALSKTFRGNIRIFVLVTNTLAKD